MSSYVLRCDKCGDLINMFSKGILEQMKIMHERTNPNHRTEIVLVEDNEKKETRNGPCIGK